MLSTSRPMGLHGTGQYYNLGFVFVKQRDHIVFSKGKVLLDLVNKFLNLA